MNAWYIIFHWPDGGIWSNLIASALWFIPGYLWGRYHVKKIGTKVQQIHDHLNTSKSYTIGYNFKVGDENDRRKFS